jgi:hypothetical protein
MRRIFLMAIISLTLLGVLAFAETKSDYDRDYDFATLRTWDYKPQTRMPADPVGANPIWDKVIRRELERRLTEKGFPKASMDDATFLVAYYMGTKERYKTRFINYGFPARWGRWRWRGWDPAWTGPTDVWTIPYTESTMVLDIVDPESNQLIWRGYDTETLDYNKSEKTIAKAVEHLTDRFAHDVKEAIKQESKEK